MNMKTTSILWLIFSFMFLLLSTTHTISSFENIQYFNSKVEYPKNHEAKILGIPFVKICISFETEINNHIKYINKSNRYSNRATALGYLLASLTSLFSMFLTIDGFRSHYLEYMAKLKDRYKKGRNKTINKLTVWKRIYDNKGKKISDTSD